MGVNIQIEYINKITFNTKIMKNLAFYISLIIIIFFTVSTKTFGQESPKWELVETEINEWYTDYYVGPDIKAELSYVSLDTNYTASITINPKRTNIYLDICINVEMPDGGLLVGHTISLRINDAFCEVYRMEDDPYGYLSKDTTAGEKILSLRAEDSDSVIIQKTREYFLFEKDVLYIFKEMFLKISKDIITDDKNFLEMRNYVKKL
jgi:hypothetical protein